MIQCFTELFNSSQSLCSILYQMRFEEVESKRYFWEFPKHIHCSCYEFAVIPLVLHFRLKDLYYTGFYKVSALLRENRSGREV